MWTIRIERQGWSGGPTASDCMVFNEIEHRDATEKLPLIVALAAFIKSRFSALLEKDCGLRSRIFL